MKGQQAERGEPRQQSNLASPYGACAEFSVVTCRLRPPGGTAEQVIILATLLISLVAVLAPRLPSRSDGGNCYQHQQSLQAI